MSDAFDAAFNAGTSSVGLSTEASLQDYKAQSMFSQATAVNAFNAAVGAAQDSAAVQKKVADNADTISLETAQALRTTAVDVMAVAKSGIDAALLGVQGIQSESVAAIKAQSELSAIQENKKNPILHPVDWVMDTLHSNKLEDTIKEHSKAVQTYTRNVNNIVQSTNNQVDTMLAQQNLSISSSMRVRAVELNKGLAAQQIDANLENTKATALGQVGKTVYDMAHDNALWVQADQRIQADLDQARVDGEANRIRLLELKREAEARKFQDGAIKQAARAYRISLGLPDTPANNNLAMEKMQTLQAQRSPEFAVWSKVGAVGVASGDKKSLTASVVQGMTVGEVVQYGMLTKDADLAAIGGKRVNELTATYEAQLRKDSYTATLAPGAEFTQAGYDIWAGNLQAPQAKAFRDRARSNAENVVYNQSTQQFVNGKAASRDVGQAKFDMGLLSSEASIVNTFGVKPEVARVLAAPQNRVFISNRAASDPNNAKTAQIVAMLEVLEKNKISNPTAAVALIAKKFGESTVDSDAELQTLGNHGVVSSGSGIINYNMQTYNLANPTDLDKMRIAVSKKDDTFFSGVSSLLGDVAEGSGFNHFMADKAKAQEALKKSQAAKSDVVMEASQYTPAGHAPQVAGGVPATALTEAEKLAATTTVQKFQQTQEANGKVSKQVELDAVNKAIGLGKK